MNGCKEIEIIGTRPNGKTLYRCKLRNQTIGSPSAVLCLNCDNYKSDPSKPTENVLRINYIGNNIFDCCWKIICSDNFIENNDIEEIYEWTCKKVSTCGAISLEKKDVRSYELKIKGNGRDGRCTWCHSFRTALNTHTHDEVNTLKKCPFD